ncbi:MobF family relaxase [Natronoglycomyces albus]|uniref:Relaxase domain-containing protein n=1 Tax=Natronoglycomyces albus TaxID=2811108 RepID=A0A895XP81_9ACTN|nr:MobF family relaxase [Natronoglycomyces albus]QSB07164.1 relaxase domain-containing protein [Natronoglycomyces albus]
MTLGIRPGSSFAYVANEVAAGAENYYSAAVATGEPAGVWRGSAAAELGLTGKANDTQLEALFGHFVDPRDERFEQRDKWHEATKLGRKPPKYRSQEEIFSELVAREVNPAGIEEERAEELWHQAGKQTREARAFFDATYSPPKSVSVLYTAFMAESVAAKQRGDDVESARWAAKAETVEESVVQASEAMIRRMEREAGYSRAGYHGGKLKSGETTGRWIDGKGFIVASFLQHTSRPTNGREDPQLHVHNLIANRIECADGVWRTLDGRALYQERAASGAVADRVMQAHLQRELGVTFAYDPKSKSHEIVGISRGVREAFSSRRTAINALLPEYVAAFENRMGREPSALELSELAQRATLKSRQAKLTKDDVKTLEEKVVEWTAQAQESVEIDLSEIAHGVINTRDEASADRVFDVDAVIARAVESVQETKTTWTRSDLAMHLHRHLPSELGSLDTEYQDRILAELSRRAIEADSERAGTDGEILPLDVPDFVDTPEVFQLTNGESAFRRHGSEQFATRRVLTAEARIERAAHDTELVSCIESEAAMEAVWEVNNQLRQADPEGVAKLGADQAAVVAGVLSSGKPLETLVGPAGTGKSFVMGTLADQWEKRIGGRVFGLATAQNAAGVLADEGLTATDNITAWLMNQRDIESSKVTPEGVAEWRLRPGDMVIVDEASMVDSVALSEIQQRTEAARAKLLLVGDHEQIDAVGAGGGFLLAQQAADRAYQLEEVRRFKSTWEKEASLRLRDGDDSVVREYDTHGRLKGCENLEDAYTQAVEAYTADIVAGRQAYLITDTNENANELSVRVRDRLVSYGLVEGQGVAIGKDQTRAIAGVGDILQARRNNRNITNAVGNCMVNRGRYLVTETHESGGLTVQPMGDNGTLGHSIDVPADYAQTQMSLAYATTQHGVQGATGDNGYGIITSSTSADAAYVAATRGRDLNLLFVVDETDPKMADQTAAPAPKEEHQRSAATIFASVIESGTPQRSATQTHRDNLADAGSMRVIGHRLYESRRRLSELKYKSLVAELLDEGTAVRLARDDAAPELYRLLESCEQAGHDPRQVASEAIGMRELESADSVAQVIHWRITDMMEVDLSADPHEEKDSTERDVALGYAERLPAGDSAIHKYAQAWAQRADERVSELGIIVAERPPQWAIEHLGPVPVEHEEHTAERAEWIKRAGTVEAYCETYSLTEQANVIGRVPSVAMPERRDEWRAAWQALGRPDPIADERQMSQTQLQRTIEAYNAEKQWAPPAVANELREASSAAIQGRIELDHRRAELSQIEPTDERHQQLAEEIDMAEEDLTVIEERRDKLDYVNDTRNDWHTQTEDARTAANAAQAELKRREREAERNRQKEEVTTERDQEQAADRSVNQKPEVTRDAEHESATTEVEPNDRGKELAEADRDQTRDEPTDETERELSSVAKAFPRKVKEINADRAVSEADKAREQIRERIAAAKNAAENKQEIDKQASADQEWRRREMERTAREAAVDQGLER